MTLAPASAVWDGATADVTVSGGAVTAASIVAGGSGYTVVKHYTLIVVKLVVHLVQM